MPILRPLLLAASLVFSASGTAGEINLPVPLNYQLMRNVLVNQLYNGENQTARLWRDGKQCSFLDLSDPQIGGENGQVKIGNRIHARFGTKLAGKCMTLLEWRGILETLQKPTLANGGTLLSLPVTSILAYDNNGQTLNIGQLQDLLQQVVGPKLADLKIDLNESRGAIVKTLLPYVPAEHSEQLHDAVNSLRFNGVAADANALMLNLGFTAKLKQPDTAPAAAFSAAELAEWQTVWQNWRGSLERAIDQMPLAAESTQNRATLLAVLQKADTAFEAGLKDDSEQDGDPVRRFIDESWTDLAPLLRTVSKQLPGAEGLRYLTLIAATDLMHEVETIGSPFGLELSSNGLRKIARSYLNHLASQS